MKIHSKFNDYYDSVIAYGQDEKCHYVRKREEFTQPRRDHHLYNSMTIPDHSCDLRKVVIGFCGKLYPLYVANYYDNHAIDHITEYLYSAEAVREYIKRRKSKKFYQQYIERDPDKRRRMRHSFARWIEHNFSDESVEWFFENHTGTEDMSWFDMHKVPVFALDPAGVGGQNVNFILNPCLKDYGFAKIKDPYQAYQDIYQFISMRFGVGEPDIETISDECMRDAKGFDNWSFKRQKTKPKGKRRKDK